MISAARAAICTAIQRLQEADAALAEAVQEDGHQRDEGYHQGGLQNEVVTLLRESQRSLPGSGPSQMFSGTHGLIVAD